MRATLLLLSLAIMIIACGADESTAVKKNPTLNLDGEEVDISKYPVPDLDPLPEDSLSLYRSSLSRLDIQILGKGPGVTLREIEEIDSELEVILDEKVTLNRDCQPGGLYTFFIDDKLAFQAEVFLEDDCQYIVFYYKSQAKFANRINPSAITSQLE